MSQPFPTSPAGLADDELATLHRAWWFFLILGLVSVVVGLVAISHALAATLASVVVLGVLLMVAGVTEVIHAFMVRNGKGFALHLVAAVLYLLVGLFMLEDPGHAARILTLLLAASFFVGGVLRILFSVAMRFPAWPWVLLHGVVDLILGSVILTAWKESNYWVIGLFVGIDLLFHGLSWVVLALAARSYRPAPTV